MRDPFEESHLISAGKAGALYFWDGPLSIDRSRLKDGFEQMPHPISNSADNPENDQRQQRHQQLELPIPVLVRRRKLILRKVWRRTI